MNKITVIIADPHELLRQGARELLKKNKIPVVAQAANGREAIHLVRKLRPSVVVLDVHLPRLNGIEASRQITELSPNTKVIFLTDATEDHHIQNALRVGASGYILKSADTSVLPKAIRTVHEGGLSFCTYVAARIKRQPKLPTPQRDPTGLTTREIQVLQLIAEGCSTKEIAQELNLSEKTVANCRGRLNAKLNMHDTASLTRFAVRAGITRP